MWNRDNAEAATSGSGLQFGRRRRRDSSGSVGSSKPDLGQPEFLSVPESARICGVSRNTVYAWVRKEKLPAYQTPGRTNLIRPCDLVHFMNQNGMFVPPSLAARARRDDIQNTGSEREPGGESSVASGGVVVLVVDDDPLTRSLAVRSIHEGYSVCQSETGYEALHLLATREDIAIVLLDLHMPGLDGLEALGEIERIRPDVSVIITTGFPQEVPEDRVGRGVVAALLPKPFGIFEVREIVSRVAEARRQGRSIPGSTEAPKSD